MKKPTLYYQGHVMTNRDAICILNQRLDALFSDASGCYGFGYSFVSDDGVLAGEGDTIRSVTGGMEFNVEDVRVRTYDEFVYDYADANGKLDEPVDSDHFTDILVAMHHEHQHVVEHFVDFLRNSDPQICPKYFATLENDGYYWMNYRTDPMEISAQYRGLWDTFEVLSGLCSEKVADACICRYQDCRFRKLKHDFIPKPLLLNGVRYDSASDIFDAYSAYFY